jgi:CBS domain-containing protein
MDGARCSPPRRERRGYQVAKGRDMRIPGFREIAWIYRAGSVIFKVELSRRAEPQLRRILGFALGGDWRGRRERAMTQITARDFMVTELVTLSPEADVLDAVQLLLEHRISGAPVVDRDGRYLGSFSEKCAMHVLLDAAYEQLPVRDVRSFMDSEVQTICPETHLLSVAQVFLLTPFRRLPVLEDGILVGQVSRRDVLACWMELIGQAPSDSTEMTLIYFSELFSAEDAPLA